MYKLRVCVFVEYEADVEEERGRVATLLKNLRIEAGVLVFWLANGGLGMYEVIVNGRDDVDFDQTGRDIDYSLEDERWWQDIKKLRERHNMSASQELAQATDLLEAITQWPTAAFQHGRRETKTKRFSALQKMLRRAKSKASVGDLSEAGVTIGMISQRLPSELMEDSDADDQSLGDEADDEAVASDSEAGISGSNFDEYDLDASEESDASGQRRLSNPMRRAYTGPTSRGSPFSTSKRFDLRKAIWKGSPKSSSILEDGPTSSSVSPLKPHPRATALDTAVFQAGMRSKHSRSVASSSSQISSSSQARSVQPPPLPNDSLPKFTSKPQPRTAVATEETQGPSIMFVETPSPTAARKKDPLAMATVDAEQNQTAPSSPQVATPAGPSSQPFIAASPMSSSTPLPTATPASGFPAQQAIPLSFNDLPCRAQHLILNELIRQHSDDTAVIFTTLPSPTEGTCDSEVESVKYISDLEVLCQGLPPALLVHSNSMTVTMNL